MSFSSTTVATFLCAYEALDRKFLTRLIRIKTVAFYSNFMVCIQLFLVRFESPILHSNQGSNLVKDILISK